MKSTRPLFLGAVCLVFLTGLGCAPTEVDESEQVSVETESTGLENGSFTAQLNGFSIHYEIHGSGPVVMVLPNSWGLSLAGLRTMFRPLEENVTMVYFDPRGIGQSDPIREETDMGMEAVRADFEALRQHLEIDQVHALGWSNGAANLIYLSAEYPEHLASAIYLHGVASFTSEDAGEVSEEYPELMETYVAFQQEISDPALTVDEKTGMLKAMWLESFFPLLLADREADLATMQEAFAEAEFSFEHGDYANRETSTFDAREILAEIPVRSLVIAGAHDMSSPSKVQVLADGLGDSEFLVIDNSGHFAPLEEPERFEEVIFDFVGVD